MYIEDSESYSIDPIDELLGAAKDGNLNAVKTLIASGININAANDDGITALWVAAFSGHLDIVDYLYKNGAILSKSTAHKTSPLWTAANNGHVHVVKYLHAQGANIDEANSDDISPLLAASNGGHLDVVKYLCENKANVNKLNETIGITPLLDATFGNNLEIIKCLCEHGANVNLSDKMGVSALWIASNNGNLDIFNYLLQQGAELDKVNQRAETTPLWAAVKHCNASKHNHLQIVATCLNSTTLDAKAMNILYKSINPSNVFEFCMLFNLNHIDTLFECLDSTPQAIDKEKKASIISLLKIKKQYDLTYDHMLFLLDPDNQGQLALLDALERNSQLQNFPEELWDKIISNAYGVITTEDCKKLVNAYRARHQIAQSEDNSTSIGQPFYNQNINNPDPNNHKENQHRL
ncbi:ankyrin repeat domain-containing protein [Thiotrichales bacterium 19S3-7]|nr:ankyrin repeat domain-containing protein [Thiotrichales bacterium 19S3-7]MCF6800946.1 ankyrin repeat domain-containing protein [Thiotrichales bacterium 19S3-11]